MNTKKKGLSLLLITIIFISLSGNVIATNIEAVFTDIKLFLNGNRVDKEILAVDGSSYLPVRAISETLGLEVKWNDEEKAIYLSGNESVRNGDDDIAKEFEILDKLEKENKELKEEIAKLQTESPVNKELESEKFNVALDEVLKVTFEEGIREKIDAIAVKNNDKFIPVELNFIDDKELTIKPINNFDSYTKYELDIYLNDGSKYYMYFNTVKKYTTTNLTDMDDLGETGKYYDLWTWRYKFITDERNHFKNVSNIKASNGKTYEKVIAIYFEGCGLKTFEKMYFEREYFLDEKYNTFKGTFALDYVDKNDDDANAQLIIYGDGNVIYTSDYIKAGSEPIDFNVDVTGYEKLMIRIFNDSEHSFDNEDDINFLILNPTLISY